MASPSDPALPDLTPLLGVGILALVIWAAVTVLIIVLALWIQYAIIWHAVRRGVREYFGPTPPNPYGTWSP